MNEDSLKMKNDQDDLKDEDNLKTEKGRLLQKLIQPQKLRGPRKKTETRFRFRFRYILKPNIFDRLNIEIYRHHNHKIDLNRVVPSSL